MSGVRASLLGLLVASVVFAGCVGNDTGPKSSAPPAQRVRPDGVPTYIVYDYPMPVLKCWQPGVCNQEMTPDDGREGNEVTIAVNPTNPKNIVGGAKDYYPLDAGECVWDGVYVTHDGGATPYEDRSLDGSPWRLAQSPTTFRPNYASQFWCTTDPVAYFSTKGTFYYLAMAYQADRITGSKTGKDVFPQGALNDWAFNRAVQIVAVSDDGGKTFHTFTPTIEGTYPVAFHDKGWIAASNSGVVHVMWLAGGPGNIYMRSTDNGKSFPLSEMKRLSGTGVGTAGQGSFLDVGPDKEVYAIWRGGGGVQMRRSFDQGETWDAARKVLDTQTRNMPGLSGRDRVRGGFPALATDRFHDSPYAGALYIVWTQGVAPNTTDIMFSSSFDRGTTWSEPLILNDDFIAEGVVHPDNWQFFATVSVSPLGVIDVSWVDTRNVDKAVLKPNMGGTANLVGQEHLKLDQYHTYSLDGGRTWSPNFRVRDVDDRGWDPQYCHHQNGWIFIGDYNDIDSSYGAGHPVWPDSRSEKYCDVYTAIVQRPIFPIGMEPARKAELREKLVKDGLVEADHPFLDR